ncbi:hypothetical protein SAMN04490248_12729 [Salinihabitans flavidus]|uniref:DUF192 domain-containing protein n=1 Tax=Salinihabitans flavidus TaxID=569882 RepID=A0A1H8VBA5_9RHOB|nr:DUF192 domain-containing protein [Salinihabitans flavidus]SEP12742.1 hypothetical protein SAMN04490248_12729 [Salinihabitans flavidus]
MRALVLGALVLAGLSGAASAACAPDEIWVRGDWGQARFRVEVADDAQTRARGLMERAHLPSSAGMLFIYERPQRVAFWMKNTLIPLDMIFADARGVVQRVHDTATPGDETPIEGGAAVQYVLEINGGLAGSLGIAPGSELRHPGIEASDAAWPCEE